MRPSPENPRRASGTAAEAMFRRIVVGVAEDERSDPAIRAGALLAERLGAELELVHGVGSDEEVAGTRSAIHERLSRDLPPGAWRERALARDLAVVAGHPVQVLLQRLEGERAPLLVVGAHRRRPVVDFGRTARALLAKAPCPIWMQPAPPRPWKKCLVAVDLSDESARVLEVAARLAGPLGLGVLVLHCFERPDFAPAYSPTLDTPRDYVLDRVRAEQRERLRELVRQAPWGSSEPDVALPEGDPVEEILRRQDDHDLVVMGTHGRTRLAAAVLGSTAYAVLREARIPVLALRVTEGEYILE